jgi:hypothetical protein
MAPPTPSRTSSRGCASVTLHGEGALSHRDARLAAVGLLRPEADLAVCELAQADLVLTVGYDLVGDAHF